jgi:hypothetical protein
MEADRMLFAILSRLQPGTSLEKNEPFLLVIPEISFSAEL